MLKTLLSLTCSSAEKGVAKSQHLLGGYYYSDGVLQDSQNSENEVAETNPNDYYQPDSKQKYNARIGLHIQNCITLTFLYLLYFTDIIRNFLITDSGLIKSLFIATLPLGFATMAILIASIFFRYGYKGNYSGFWFILLLVIVYTVYASTGFIHGIIMLIVNVIVAIPAVFFIFVCEDSYDDDNPLD